MCVCVCVIMQSRFPVVHFLLAICTSFDIPVICVQQRNYCSSYDSDYYILNRTHRTHLFFNCLLYLYM